MSLKKAGGLKALRKQATDPNRFLITCPACGESIERGKIGVHHLTCKAWGAAMDDSNKKPMTQADLIRQKHSFSTQWAPVVLDADFTRRHWIWMTLSIGILSWGIGYLTPQAPQFWITIGVVPGAFVSFLAFFWFLDKRGRIRPARNQ